LDYTCFSVDDWPIECDILEYTRLWQHSTTAARKGCKMPPLLNIPSQFVVVDTLHLFLRIMGHTRKVGVLAQQWHNSDNGKENIQNKPPNVDSSSLW